MVEDSPAVADMMKDILEQEFSAHVETVMDCASARKKLASGRFDVVALDYRLPDGHGHELLSEITLRPDHPPVIMVTAHGDEDIAALSLRLGASGYVVKDKKMRSMLTEAVSSALDELALRKAEEELRESEERYRLLAELSPSGILVHDGFNILYANESIRRITGYPREHFKVMDDILSLLVPEEREKVIYRMKARLAGLQVPSVYDTRVTRKDGTIAEVQLSNVMAKLKGKSIVMVNVNDVTERIQAEESLRREKAFTEAALNALSDIFVVFDTKGNLLRWNRALGQVSGYDNSEIAEMKRKSLMAVTTSAEKETYGELFAGTRSDFEADILSKDGARVPFEFTGSLVKGEEDEPIAFCAIGREKKS